jgi:hypothetical protein
VLDGIDGAVLMGRRRSRIGGKRVLGLITAFPQGGILTVDRLLLKKTTAGTSQDGILSPMRPTWRCRY